MQFDQLKRRDFITLMGGAAAVWPLAARAQQAGLPVIGFLSISSQQIDEGLRLAPFREGLKEAGYIEGRNVVTEYRGAQDRSERLPELAADLVRLRPAAIITLSGPSSTLVAKAASTTVPIVFTIAGDPVKLGLVASFNRPGGNITGITTLTNLVVAKQFETLHETVPAAKVVGCLVNPNNPNTETDATEAHAAARLLGLELEVVPARNESESEIESAFATLMQKRAGAMVVVADAFFNSRAEHLAALSIRHGMPAVYSLREFARAGGLMSYGTSLAEAYRQAGVHTGRILKGERAADLPVIQVTKVELTINTKTAKALGVVFPLSLLGRADEVIE